MKDSSAKNKSVIIFFSGLVLLLVTMSLSMSWDSGSAAGMYLVMFLYVIMIVPIIFMTIMTSAYYIQKMISKEFTREDAPFLIGMLLGFGVWVIPVVGAVISTYAM